MQRVQPILTGRVERSTKGLEIIKVEIRESHEASLERTEV